MSCGGLSIEVPSVGENEWHESGPGWLSVGSAMLFLVSSIRMIVASALMSSRDCLLSVRDVRALNVVMSGRSSGLYGVGGSDAIEKL